MNSEIYMSGSTLNHKDQAKLSFFDS